VTSRAYNGGNAGVHALRCGIHRRDERSDALEQRARARLQAQ